MMRSRSTFGLSLITLVFRDGIEDYWARQRINERIQNVTLPPGLTPGLDPLSSPTGQIYYYTLESDTKNLRELSEIERWIVIPALKQVPGVADVSNFGGVTTQFQLELDPQQLMRFNLSLNECRPTAINANNANAGGSVRQPRRARLRDPRHRPGADARRPGQHRRDPAQRHADPGARPRQAQAQQPGAPRHRRQGRQQRRRRGHRAAAAAARTRRGCSRASTPRSPSSTPASKADDVQIVPYLDRADLVDADHRQGLATPSSRASAWC